jgi:hypothetical protein
VFDPLGTLQVGSATSTGDVQRDEREGLRVGVGRDQGFGQLEPFTRRGVLDHQIPIPAWMSAALQVRGDPLQHLPSLVMGDQIGQSADQRPAAGFAFVQADESITGRQSVTDLFQQAAGEDLGQGGEVVARCHRSLHQVHHAHGQRIGNPRQVAGQAARRR